MFGGIRNHLDINLADGDAELGYQLFNIIKYYLGCSIADDIFVYPKTT